jgi:hypothetical protein
MPPPKHDKVPADWSTPELMLMLLRQFRNLLAERGAKYDDVQLRQLTTDPTFLNDEWHKIISAMQAIVAESVQFLAGWNLTYAQSLKTDMNDLAHLWQSTAEFLDVANQKNNAELRINGGSALLGLLSIPDVAPQLLATVEYDLDHYRDFDIDGAIAQYVLCQLADVRVDDTDWLAQVRAWMG